MGKPFWRLVASFATSGNFWHVLCNFCYLLATFVNYWHVWHPFASTGNFLVQISAILCEFFGILWPLLEALALEGHFWLILATFGQLFKFFRKFFQNLSIFCHLNQLLALLASFGLLQLSLFGVSNTSFSPLLYGRD